MAKLTKKQREIAAAVLDRAERKTTPKQEFKAERERKNEELLAMVLRHEAAGRLVYWIPDDGSSLVEGRGYRACIVRAGEDGYHYTGTWPYHGKVGERMPYFWGPTLEDAQRIAREMNERMGVSHEEVMLIISRSMARGTTIGRRS